jgi:DNA repair photolyase
MKPTLRRAKRVGPVLHPTPLAGADDVLGLNLTRGCGHCCPFCSVRASPNYPDGETILFTNTVDLLAQELAVARPRAVYLCPAADPFPPEPEVQEMAADVVSVLAAHGVEAWVMTRGEPAATVLDSLAANGAFVRFTVALPTLSPTLSRLLEDGASAPSARLDLLGELRRRGIAAQAAIDPLIPGLTDTPEALTPLLDALAERGVRSVTASYLFLRQAIEERLSKSLPADLASAVLTPYATGPVLSQLGLAAARFLPRARRQRGYAGLMALAARHGIKVTLSSLTNPDFAPTPAAPSGPGLRQLAEARVISSAADG